MTEIALEWITRINTPSQATLYVSTSKQLLLITDRRLDTGGEPIAAIDLANTISAEIDDLIQITHQLRDSIDTSDKSFEPVFDFGHEAAAAIVEDHHPMIGVALIGAPESLMTAEDFTAGRTTAFDAGGVDLLPISLDLGALVGDLPHSHVVLVLTAADTEA